MIIVSGNLSFLNHLTIIPSLACLDDRFWRWFFPSSLWLATEKAEIAQNVEGRRPVGEISLH